MKSNKEIYDARRQTLAKISEMVNELVEEFKEPDPEGQRYTGTMKDRQTQVKNSPYFSAPTESVITYTTTVALLEGVYTVRSAEPGSALKIHIPLGNLPDAGIGFSTIDIRLESEE